jgi:D12 class N6 adenine-specific DNA methyltransferase.
MFLNRESFGEQGELMLEALGASVKGRSEYDVTQGFHPYPGRLHPDLPKILLKQFPEGSTVFDPFMGGGTVLLEGLLWKHKVLGNDLNPIAKMVTRERCRWISEKNASRVWSALEDVRERVNIRSLEKKKCSPPKFKLAQSFPSTIFVVELLHWIDGIEKFFNSCKMNVKL